MTFAIALFRQGFTSAPSNMTVSWDELVKMLSYVRFCECTAETCAHRRCPYRNGPCWSPSFTAREPAYTTRCQCELRQRAWNPNTGRCETCGSSFANPHTMGAATTPLLVLDVDDCSEADAIAVRENLLRYRHLIHATHSDRPEARCLRIVIPYVRPVTLVEDLAVRQVLASWGPFVAADRTSNNGRRVHYVASRPRGSDFFLDVHDGDPIDADALLIPPPAQVPSNLEMQS